MVLIEKKTIELWGAPVANSAVLLSAGDGKQRGLLIEADAGLRFRAAGEAGPRLEVAWQDVRAVRTPFLSPRRLDLDTADGRHRVRLTDAVIDSPLDGHDGGGGDAFPIEGGARPSDQTREERLLDDAATAVGALTVAIGRLAADRVRRRRVADRIRARAGEL